MLEEKKFGLRLKELRNALKLEQEAFGKKIGVSASAVGQAENGKQGFKIATLINISKTWCANLDWLLTGDGQMFKEQSRIGSEKKNSNSNKTEFEIENPDYLKQQLFYKDEYIRLLNSTNALLEEKVAYLKKKIESKK